MSENELAIMAEQVSLAKPPSEVLSDAKKAAVALKGVLDAKPKKVMINNEQYLEFEDWQTVGKFYGVTVKVVSTAPVQFGDAMGFEATAAVLRADGCEISRAESMCLNDEERWRGRPKYGVMENGQRGITGNEPVPLFQLRSMAQTRACSKALRNVLAWVVVLAGYRPTPAEEMDGVPGTRTNGTAPAPAAPRPAAAVAPQGAPANAQPVNGNAGRGVIASVDLKDGQGPKGPWHKTAVKINGEDYSTFDTDLGATLESLMNAEVSFTFEMKGKYKHITSVDPIMREPGEDAE